MSDGRRVEDQDQIQRTIRLTGAFRARGMTLSEAWHHLLLNEDRLARGGTSPSRGWQIMAEAPPVTVEPRATCWQLTCPDCGKVWGHVVGYGRWQAVGGWHPDEPIWPDGLRTSPRASVPEGPRRLPPRRFATGLKTDLLVITDTIAVDVARTIPKPRQCPACRAAGLMPAPERRLPEDAYKLLEELLSLESWRPSLHIARRPDAGGMKRCVWCRGRYDAGRKRWDALCCSGRCRKARRRRIDTLRKMILATGWGEVHTGTFDQIERQALDDLESIKAGHRIA